MGLSRVRLEVKVSFDLTRRLSFFFFFLLNFLFLTTSLHFLLLLFLSIVCTQK